jgi:beta-N-acetylhexosaminidase
MTIVKTIAFSVAAFLISISLLLVSFTDVPGLGAHETTELKLPDESIEEIEARLAQVYSTQWVDSVFAGLTLDQRIAQLLMIRVHTDQDPAYYERKVQEVARYNIGGVAFFRGGPVRQAQITNRLQQAAATPLLIAMDAEWGLAMRLDSTISFPRQMTLGAIHDEEMIYRMGLEVGRQLKRIGVHMNFAPVIDVNNNPANPVINFRAFGEDREQVARRGAAYMKGMQDIGILACAKHFPGHGDTDADSHYTLPLLNHSFQEIDSIHLYPFRELIRQGLHSVMVAHLQIPAIEPERNLASTLSENTVAGLLIQHLGFEGLVVTDALDMRGVSDYFRSGELELRALMAGNDILLLPENVPAAIAAIKKAIEQGKIPEEIVNIRCRKILYYKEKAGLKKGGMVALENLVSDLNPAHAKQLNKNLAEASVTLVKNHHDLLPVKSPYLHSVASVAIGAGAGGPFQTMLGRYADLPAFVIHKEHGQEQANRLLRDLEPYDLVIISVHNNSMFQTRQYGIDSRTVALVQSIARNKRVVLTLFANPYSLGLFENVVNDMDAILIAYQEGRHFEEGAAQIIFGGLQAKGRLPVSISPLFPAGKGLITPEKFRVGFGDPEDVGIDSRMLQKVDSIVHGGLAAGAYPGCQVVLIKDGMVIYNKAFGHHTYDKRREVRTSDIYDLASITKIAATTAAIMQLSERGMIDLDGTLGDYLPWLKGSNKERLILREVMAHQARLEAWIPFFRETLPGNGPEGTTVYSHLVSGDFPVEVASNLYIRKDYRDTIFTRILDSPLRIRRNYLYSDLGFILLAEIIEKVSGLSLDRYTGLAVFKPLGLRTMGFRPLEHFPRERIVPSEKDTIFRKQVIHGHVNDPAAAMLGGVAGHAGLFSNALDLGILMQMFLQKGEFAGRQYFHELTVREFTRVQYGSNNNRRGLGFDKPSLKANEPGPSCKSASPASYGHSGFTGTYTWVDPEANLVYVFLSNRTYPDQSNRGITQMDIRTNIHQAVYDAIEATKKRGNRFLP